MKKAPLAGYIVLTLEFRNEGEQWTAYCEELGTASFGPSLAEADKRIKEAIFLHLNTLEDVDERERFFAENGITIHIEKPKEVSIKTPFGDDEIYFQPFIQELAPA